jgi:cobyrinic acid a,c-diamide synthase
MELYDCTKINSKSFNLYYYTSLGYREAVFCSDNFLGQSGTTIRGHEFHWSHTKFEEEVKHLYNIRGIRNKMWTETGYCSNNICASYIHVHFASNKKIVKKWFNDKLLMDRLCLKQYL